MKKIDMRAAVFALLCFTLIANPAQRPGDARSSKEKTQDENVAVIIGESGEQYPIYGSGGIRVSGGHHGMWMSNMKRSSIEIDGSAIATQKMTPLSESSDFTASGNASYFVARSAVCTLPPAASASGQEIIVCNANDDTSITYKTSDIDKVIGFNQTASIVNSTLGKTDRFISDGKNWFKE